MIKYRFVNNTIFFFFCFLFFCLFVCLFVFVVFCFVLFVYLFSNEMFFLFSEANTFKSMFSVDVTVGSTLLDHCLKNYTTL